MSITRLKLEGRLDTAELSRVELPFTAKAGALNGPDARAIIDLTELTYLSSLGIRLLVTTLKQFGSRGVKFATVLPQAPLAREILETASLMPLLGAVETEAQAEEVLSPSEA